MKKVLTLTLSLLLLCSFAAQAQNTKSTSSTKSTADSNRAWSNLSSHEGPDQSIQSILKERGFYGGDQTGKLDDATREGLRKYQQAEGLKTTGTLNKATLEKMGVALTDRQKTM